MFCVHLCHLFRLYSLVADIIIIQSDHLIIFEGNINNISDIHTIIVRIIIIMEKKFDVTKADIDQLMEVFAKLSPRDIWSRVKRDDFTVKRFSYVLVNFF